MVPHALATHIDRAPTVRWAPCGVWSTTENKVTWSSHAARGGRGTPQAHRQRLPASPARTHFFVSKVPLDLLYADASRREGVSCAPPLFQRQQQLRGPGQQGVVGCDA